MASSQCLIRASCQYKNLTPKLCLNKSFKANKFNSIICATRRSCILKAKRSGDEGDQEKNERKVRILIAGGGVGGLVLALAAKQKGFEVMVFEKDLSAVRGEGRHRGPIQLLSSALGVLDGIDKDLVKKIMDAGCVTGNRINGLADGLTGNWLAKYDLLAPATKNGLPVTLVICRMALQEILLNAVGSHILFNKSKVVDFSQDPHKVVVTLDDGRQFEGDILVGADGIWSEVRKKLFGAQEAIYSGYTCYSGLAEYTPTYINSIGYRVFLGSNQYFVASDVGNGKMQWYAFHKDAPSSTDTPAGKKVRLMELFGSWCSDVTTLIAETREEMIYHRDIYDRDIIYSWGIGRVTLLGDAAHPMQPNLGQGGCLAIEDCHQLILELESIKKHGSNTIKLNEIVSALKRYEQKRIIRTKIVHRVTRMASKALSVYQPYIYLWKFRLPVAHFLPSFGICFEIGFAIFHDLVAHWPLDCHQLILELESIKKCESDAIKSNEMASETLKRYEDNRLFRTRIVLEVTRMASKSLGVYQPFTNLGILWLPVGFPKFYYYMIFLIVVWVNASTSTVILTKLLVVAFFKMCLVLYMINL